MLDIGGHGIAEDQNLDDGHEEDDALHLRIAENLDEFLYEHVPDTFDHGYTNLFLNFTLASATIRTPKMVSSPASSASICSPTPFR